MYWDRFDICEAYYCYMMLHHGGQWSKEYALSGTFHRLGFKLSPLFRDETSLSENGRVIYDGLVSGDTELRDRRS